MRADDCRRYYEAIHLHHKKKTKAQNPGKKGFTLNEQPFSRALTIAVAIMKQFICTQ